MIEIPIRVLSSSGGGSDETYCNPNIEVCSDVVIEYDRRDKIAFDVIGVISWIRSFFVCDFIAFLPEAITYTMVRAGNVNASKAFMFTTRVWVNSMGWLATFGNISLNLFLFWWYWIW